MSGGTADLRAITASVEGDAGVEHGALLVAFANAVQGDDDARLAATRRTLRAVLSPEAFVDACAIVGAFNVVDRIADATGIPLDPMLAAMTGDVRQELGLAGFRSSANTPGA